LETNLVADPNKLFTVKIVTYLVFFTSIMTLENTTEPANLELTTENVINVAQNEPHYICDSIVNATEEKKTFNMPQNL